MNSRRTFYFIGVLFLTIFAIRTFIRIATNTLSFIECLMYATAAFICFAGGYIFPHFKENDERTSFIKQKGMKCSFIALFIYMVIILYGSYFHMITLKIFDLITLLIALTVITLYSSWIILSKKY
ncbi:hypothetical protein VSK91_02910 [Bacillus swezeyi]|uniref:hypothetical protein n=1 Tax=Bacillus swezeyi TaxID=1925020 RepID=UPI0039C5CEDD